MNTKLDAESQGRTRRIIWTTMRRLETLFRLAWLINLLVFLRHGKYASVVDRLVGMRMVRDFVLYSLFVCTVCLFCSLVRTSLFTAVGQPKC